jgi:hypothetical protein
MAFVQFFSLTTWPRNSNSTHNGRKSLDGACSAAAAAVANGDCKQFENRNLAQIISKSKQLDDPDQRGYI